MSGHYTNETPLKAPTITREQAAAGIMKEPWFYMICEGCSSIANRNLALTCPVCKGYQWDWDLQRIVDLAREIGSRPAQTTYDD